MCGRKAEDPVQLLVPANQLRNRVPAGLTGRPSARSPRQCGNTRKRPNATLAGVSQVRSISR
jgi:hypothetical protein